MLRHEGRIREQNANTVPTLVSGFKRGLVKIIGHVATWLLSGTVWLFSATEHCATLACVSQMCLLKGILMATLEAFHGAHPTAGKTSSANQRREACLE